MQRLPLKLEKKLESRRQVNAFRSLTHSQNLIDFSSNDYLGFTASGEIFRSSNDILEENNMARNGSGGSRLLSGNHQLYDKTEAFLAGFHQTESALIFNSGYNANLGFFASVPQRGDFIFYDEFVHASIRDGIRMSPAKAYKFRHNDLIDLKKLIKKFKTTVKTWPSEIYIVTESVFSMDGDSPDLRALAKFTSENNFFLIIDEAHATGVFGKKGGGLVEELKIQEQVFARIVTFGKALGCHGAAVLGSCALKKYLINFARSFIYTTALPPHAVATILAAYQYLEVNSEPDQRFSEIDKLRSNIAFFNSEIGKNKLQSYFIESESAVHTCIVPGNERVKNISEGLKTAGFDVKPILSPTVPVGKERLRFCVHSYNSTQEISEVLHVLTTFVEQEPFPGLEPQKS